MQTEEGVRKEAIGEGCVQVWDVPVRVFHWSVVALLLASWISAERGLMSIHFWSGTTLLALLIFRIAWGFMGSTTALFRSFVKPPKAVVGYFQALRRGDKPQHAGHNPAGGWMVVALMALLTAQATSGLFANDDIHFNGPLSYLISKEISDRVTDLHGRLFDVILLFAWTHLVAVFFYYFVKGENLIVPMLTGNKARCCVPPEQTLRFARSYVATLVLSVSIAIVWWIVH